MARLVVGCGYLGRRVAQRWVAAGHTVYALTRSAARAGQLASLGIQPLVGDVTRPASLPNLPAADTLLWAVGFDRDSDRAIDEVYVDGVRNLTQVLPKTLGRLIYISSTGVYGRHEGDWVDENTPCEPVRAGGKACLAAERYLQGSPFCERVIILRLAGIYGPDRLPRAAALRAGRPLATVSEGVINLIHVDDAVAAVDRAATAGIGSPATFLVADGHPVLRRDFYAELARLIDAPAPRFVPPEPRSSAARRSWGSKRVSNRRMIDELGWMPRYPSYREGLAAIFPSPRSSDRL